MPSMVIRVGKWKREATSACAEVTALLRSVAALSAGVAGRSAARRGRGGLATAASGWFARALRSGTSFAKVLLRCIVLGRRSRPARVLLCSRGEIVLAHSESRQNGTGHRCTPVLPIATHHHCAKFR